MKKYVILLICFVFIGLTNAQHAPFANFNPNNNSYIDYGKGTTLNCINTLSTSNKLTITMWVRWSDKGAAGVGNWANLFTLADSVSNGDNGVFWVQHNSDNTKFEFALHTNSRTYIQSSTNPQNNQWYFLTLVYDGSLPNNNMKLYVNGNLESTMNKTGNIRNFTPASKLNMGRWPYAGNNYRHFNGKMDEVSIWNIALTPLQISNMMTIPESVTGNSYDAMGLFGYWNFDNLTADDLGACGNNGVVGGGASLPVTLITFNAKQRNSSIDLDWSTSSEINNSEFNIERSLDGLQFEKIGEIKGAGNSNKILNYSFTDLQPLIGNSYYRLIQVDYDGKQNISQVIVVNYNLWEDFKVTVFPNPSFGKNLQISSNSLDEDFDIIVFDLYGKEVFRSKSNNGSLELAYDDFEQGIFILNAKNNEKVNSVKFIIN